jgi:hypothetical protein
VLSLIANPMRGFREIGERRKAPASRHGVYSFGPAHLLRFGKHSKRDLWIPQASSSWLVGASRESGRKRQSENLFFMKSSFGSCAGFNRSLWRHIYSSFSAFLTS